MSPHKIPPNPATLAASIFAMAEGTLKQMNETTAAIHKEAVALNAEDIDPEELAAEILCSLLWLSLSILSTDDFASDRNLFSAYLAITLEELEGLTFEKLTYAISIQEVAQETCAFYLYDKPTLAEAIKQFPILEMEFKEVEEMKNWLCIFLLKAKYRTFKVLGSTISRSIWASTVGMLVVIRLTEAAEFFESLRPVLVLP